MNVKLPPPIVSFFEAFNAHDTDHFVTLFTADALVTDEAQEYRGGTAIKGWIERANAQYKPKAEVTGLATTGDMIVVTAQISGTFPGSPIQLRHKFTLRDDKIAALTIEP
jgi:hypothetical protein